MAQAVLALGVATVTAAGSVWYLPALDDLRAGADRPPSHRRAAAACLSGWTTFAVAAGLLLLSAAWWMASVAAVAGTAATVGLRTGAAVQRRRETREVARAWAELGQDRQPPDTERVRNVVVAVLIGSGPAAAVAAGVLGMAAGPERGLTRWAVAVVPCAVVGVFLTGAALSMRALRRR